MYKIGLDISSIGYFALMNCDTKEIVSICKVPQKIGISEYEKQIAKLKPLLKEKGMKTKTQKQIVDLNNKILNCSRDVYRVMDWLYDCKARYNPEIVNIEKPLMQTNSPTSVQSIAKMAEYMGIVTTMLDYIGLEYNIISEKRWRANFNYNKPSELWIKETMLNNKKTKSECGRIFVKQESIRIGLELVKNIESFWIQPRCRVISNDIVESCLLGLV